MEVDCLTLVGKNEDYVQQPIGQCLLISRRAVGALPLPSKGTSCCHSAACLGDIPSVSRSARENTILMEENTVWGQGQNYVAMFLLQSFQKCSCEKQATCFFSYPWCIRMPLQILTAEPYGGSS